jgi:hypothetical protein
MTLPRIPSNYVGRTRLPALSATRTNSALSSPAPPSTAMRTRGSATSISRGLVAGARQSRSAAE